MRQKNRAIFFLTLIALISSWSYAYFKKTTPETSQNKLILLTILNGADGSQGPKGPKGDDALPARNGRDGDNGYCEGSECRAQGLPGSKSISSVLIQATSNPEQPLAPFLINGEPSGSIVVSNSISLLFQTISEEGKEFSSILTNTADIQACIGNSVSMSCPGRNNPAYANDYLLFASHGNIETLLGNHLVSNAQNEMRQLLRRLGATDQINELKNGQSFTLITKRDVGPGRGIFLVSNSVIKNRNLLIDGFLLGASTKSTEKVYLSNLEPAEVCNDSAILSSTYANGWSCKIQNAVQEQHFIHQTLLEEDFSLNTLIDDDFDDASIIEAKFANATITGIQINNGAIIEEKLLNNAICSNVIADQAVQSKHIIDNTITSLYIANQAITSRIVQDLAFTHDKIAANAIGGNSIDNYQIQSRHLSAFFPEIVQASHIRDTAITGTSISNPYTPLGFNLTIYSNSSNNVPITILHQSGSAQLSVFHQNSSNMYFGNSIQWHLSNAAGTLTTSLTGISDVVTPYFSANTVRFIGSKDKNGTSVPSGIHPDNIQNGALVTRHFHTNATIPEGFCVFAQNSSTCNQTGWCRLQLPDSPVTLLTVTNNINAIVPQSLKTENAAHSHVIGNILNSRPGDLFMPISPGATTQNFSGILKMNEEGRDHGYGYSKDYEKTDSRFENRHVGLLYSSKPMIQLPVSNAVPDYAALTICCKRSSAFLNNTNGVTCN